MTIRIPGTAGVAEAKAERLSQAVLQQLNLAMPPPPEQKSPSAGDLGKRLQTARLA